MFGTTIFYLCNRWPTHLPHGLHTHRTFAGMRSKTVAQNDSQFPPDQWIAGKIRMDFFNFQNFPNFGRRWQVEFSWNAWVGWSWEPWIFGT